MPVKTIQNLRPLGFDLKVNGLQIERIELLPRPYSRGDFDLVLMDPTIGCFPLTEAFDLEIRRQEKDAAWRQVKLEQLVEAVRAARQLVEADLLPKAPKRAEASTEIKRRLREPIGGDEDTAHVYMALETLYRNQIPAFWLAGDLILIPDLTMAELALVRSGFRQNLPDRESFTDPKSGKTFQLYERRGEIGEELVEW